jgi:excisionase family DNA binding protein
MALSVHESAVALGVSRDTVERLMRGGALRSVLLGSRRVVPVDAINALLGNEMTARAGRPSVHADQARGEGIDRGES